MFVLQHIHGMDYLASRPGREFSTDSEIEFAMKFDTREAAEEAERTTPGLWSVKPLIGASTRLSYAAADMLGALDRIATEGDSLKPDVMQDIARQAIDKALGR
jgi:hypothetical protein